MQGQILSLLSDTEGGICRACFSFTPPVTETTLCSDDLEHCQYNQEPIAACPLSPGPPVFPQQRQPCQHWEGLGWVQWLPRALSTSLPREGTQFRARSCSSNSYMWEWIFSSLMSPHAHGHFPSRWGRDFNAALLQSLPSHPAHCSTGPSPWLIGNPGTSEVNQLPKLPNLCVCVLVTLSKNQQGCPCYRSRTVHHKQLLLLCSEGQEVQYFLFWWSLTLQCESQDRSQKNVTIAEDSKPRESGGLVLIFNLTPGCNSRQAWVSFSFFDCFHCKLFGAGTVSHCVVTGCRTMGPWPQLGNQEITRII